MAQGQGTIDLVTKKITFTVGGVGFIKYTEVINPAIITGNLVSFTFDATASLFARLSTNIVSVIATGTPTNTMFKIKEGTLSNDAKNILDDLVLAIDQLSGEIEIEIEVEKEDNEIKKEFKIDDNGGSISQNVITIVNQLCDQIGIDLSFNKDEVKIKIKRVN